MKNRDTVFNKYKTFNIKNPLLKSNKGGIFEMTDNSIDKYKSQLYTLLFTNIGDRVMIPNYGINLQRYLFENIDDTTYISIKKEIEKAVSRWVPQVKLLDVTFEEKEDGMENNKITIKIDFSLIQDESISDFIEIEVGT